MNFELENFHKESKRLESLRRKTVINLARLFDSFKSFPTKTDENEERELALEKACTLLMRINSGFNKVKKFNGKYDDCDGITADRFLQYLIIDEMKEKDHDIQNVAEPQPFSNSLYKRGYVGDAFVTHLIDQLRGLCYIIDCESMPKLKGLFDQKLQPLKYIPEPREHFAYLYEDSILFRASRCDQFIPYTEGTIEILLIDIGCKITVDINKSKRHFFVLSDTVKLIPGYIRKCQIFNMPRDLNMLDLLHARIQYNIIFNDGETVYINVLAENSQQFYGNQPDDQHNFYSYLWADSRQLSSLANYETKQTGTETVTQAITLSASAKAESIEQKIKDDPKIIPAATSESNSSEDQFAEKTENRIAEPAENSSKHNGIKMAATGRKTRAEIASMLYNSKEEDVKLSDIKVSHPISEPQSQAISQETFAETSFRFKTIIQSSNVPNIGKKITVQATNILDVSMFYGYNIDDNLPYEEFFEHFGSESLSKIDFQLKINDKILAQFENNIYRAVVAQIFDINLFKVFYIDFGHYHKVTSANLFKWDPKMDELPVRAHRFRINGIRPLFKDDICGNYGAQQILLASTVEATVVDVCDDNGLLTIVIDAIDENGLNVATTFTDKNFAIYN